MVICCKGQVMDYVKKETGERIIAVKGTHIIKTSEGIKAVDFFVKSDSPDYNTILKMNMPTLCNAEVEQINTRNGSLVKYYDLQPLEEIDLLKLFQKKTK